MLYQKIAKWSLWVFPLGALFIISGGTCPSLKGTILGVDLKYFGALFYVLLFIITSLCGVVQLFGNYEYENRAYKGLSALCAIGIGAEVIFVGFMVINDTYCVKCLASGLLLLLLFIITSCISNIRLRSILICVFVGALLTAATFHGEVMGMCQ